MDENMIVEEMIEEELLDQVITKKPMSLACIIAFALSIASLALAVLSLFFGFESLVVPGLIVTFLFCVINMVECATSAEWYYAGYYPEVGSDSNYDICDLSGWGPDYGDPQTYLDTMLPDGVGYMTKAIGLF